MAPMEFFKNPFIIFCHLMIVFASPLFLVFPDFLPSLIIRGPICFEVDFFILTFIRCYFVFVGDFFEIDIEIDFFMFLFFFCFVSYSLLVAFVIGSPIRNYVINLSNCV